MIYIFNFKIEIFFEILIEIMMQKNEIKNASQRGRNKMLESDREERKKSECDLS